MDINRLVVKARKSISKYCYEECHAYCCRKGYLVMTEKESVLVANKKRDEMIQQEVLKKLSDGNYSMFLGNSIQTCPSLIENKCTIHKKKGRPTACKEFPIFIWQNNTIKVSQRCPAVREGLLYPYIARMKLLGHKIIYGLEERDYLNLPLIENQGKKQ